MRVRNLKIILLTFIIAISLAPQGRTQAKANLPAAVGFQIYLPLISKACVQSFPYIPPADLANEQAIANGINAQRAANGLPPLTLVSELTQAARLHSRDMADHNFTSHTGSDGSDPGQRITSACYLWTTWGEIIGWGFGGNANQMLNWWMNSPPHRADILNPNFHDFGIGYAYNPNSDWQHYWTVDFGAR